MTLRLIALAGLLATPAFARYPVVTPMAADAPFASLREANERMNPTPANPQEGAQKAEAKATTKASRAPRFHANARVGLTYARLPVVVTRTDGFNQSLEFEGAGGPGLVATFEMWPVFAEHFGIGGYATGMAAATTGDKESTGVTGYDLGGAAYVGPDRVASLVGRFSVGYRQAGVIDGFGLGGFGGGEAGAGSISTDTTRYGIGARACAVRNSDDTRCALQFEYLWNREGVAGTDERVTVHGLRVDWRGYLAVGGEYAPAWFAFKPDEAPAAFDGARYFAVSVEYRNDFFGGAWW